MDWPASLQQYLNARDFVTEFVDPTIKSETEVGPPKSRRRYTGLIQTYSGSIDLHYDDYNTLVSFYNVSTNGGVLPFNFTDPISGATVEVKFVAPPTIKVLGGEHFLVNLRFTTT